MTTKNLKTLLKGCKPFRDAGGNVIVQSIANMQVVCLTADDEFSINRFANPMTVLASNKGYGHMKLRNPDGKPMIVPAQIAVLNKQEAQNHGMVKGAYIPIRGSEDFDDAGCIQGGQHGTIRETHDNDIRFIPFGAREYIFEKVNVTEGHSNIYAAIELVGRETGANSGTYLDAYFAKYDKKLAEFIAHFERPARTIGVIVFVDGEIIAVDKFPSFDYCAQVWDALIRDCYGSIAITEEIKGGKAPKPFTENIAAIRKSGKALTQEKAGAILRKAYDKTRKDLTALVRERVEDLLELDLIPKKDKTEDAYVSEILRSTPDSGYIGQVISEGSGDMQFHHLVSVVRRRSFKPERFREASKMRKLARKQDDFSI